MPSSTTFTLTAVIALILAGCDDGDPAAPQLGASHPAIDSSVDALALEWIVALENDATRTWLLPFVEPERQDRRLDRLRALEEIGEAVATAAHEEEDADLPLLAALELLYAAERPGAEVRP